MRSAPRLAGIALLMCGCGAATSVPTAPAGEWCGVHVSVEADAPGGSEEFRLAKQAFSSERWHMVPGLLEPVLQGKTTDDGAHVEEAQFMLAAAAFRGGQQERAQAMFTAIAKDATHSRRGSAASWLCAKFGGEGSDRLAASDRALLAHVQEGRSESRKDGGHARRVAACNPSTVAECGACDARDVNGCHALAVRFEHGDGVPQSYLNAALYHGDACILGSAESCLSVGQWFTDGSHSIKKNERLGRQLLDKACKLGVRKACSEGQGTADPGATAETAMASAGCSTGSCPADAPRCCWDDALKATSCQPETADTCMWPVCRSDEDCPDRMKDGWMLRECDRSARADDDAAQSNSALGACMYQPLHGPPSAAVEKSDKEYNESKDCSNVADCERFCRRDLKRIVSDRRKYPGGAIAARSFACDNIIGLADPFLNGSGASTGAAQAVHALTVVCDGDGAVTDTQTKACRMVGFAYGKGLGVGRDLRRSIRYYAHACKLSPSEGDCASAEGGACVLKVQTSSRRSPDIDPYCNPRFGRPGRGPIKAYRPDDPGQRIEEDACFDAMRSVGCTGTNVATKGQSAYCCGEPGSITLASESPTPTQVSRCGSGQRWCGGSSVGTCCDGYQVCCKHPGGNFFCGGGTNPCGR